MPWTKQFDSDAALEHAMQAFWRHGYEATSMQDLVDCMGVNRGSLYATFGDKHAIFVAALLRYDEQMRQQTIAGIEATHSPRDAIRALFAAFTDNVSEKGGNRGCFLTNTALELAAHDKEIAAIVANAQKGIEAFFLRMILSGKARGEIAERIKAEEAARGLLAALIGVVVLARSRPDRSLLKSIVDDAIARLE